MANTFRLCLVAFVTVVTMMPAWADVYEWDDNFTGSTFFGGFTTHRSRLLPTTSPNVGLLTLDAVRSSDFFFTPFRQFANDRVRFQIIGISPGGIQVDRTTGAILSDGQLFFGPSNVVNLPSGLPYQIAEGRIDLDRKFNVVDVRGGGGGENAYLRTAGTPNEFFASDGFWRVNGQILPTPVPGPAAVVLFGLAFGVLFCRQSSGAFAGAGGPDRRNRAVGSEQVEIRS